MLKIVTFFLTVFVVALLAVWVADNPGTVTIDFQAHRINTSFAIIIAVIALIGALAGGTVWLIGYLRRELPVIGKNASVKRQTRGLKMLNQSLVALSAGDHKLASHLVSQAEVLLPPQPMVHLIAAEASTRNGDFKAAKKTL